MVAIRNQHAMELAAGSLHDQPGAPGFPFRSSALRLLILQGVVVFVLLLAWCSGPTGSSWAARAERVTVLQDDSINHFAQAADATDTSIDSRRLFDAATFSENPGPKCHMSSSELCPVSDMAGRSIFTSVYPGGRTRCLLNNTGADKYSFQVIPGDADKLLIYFQGGGSCWDEGSTLMHLCTRSVRYQEEVGIFDRQNASNPFWRYTVLHIGYCTGDAHGGHRTRPWKSPVEDATVEQWGFVNAMSAISWAKANVGKLESLVLAGSSAGSMAVQLYARWLLKEFRYENAAVIADSYSGVFPRGVQGPLIRDLGACTTGILSTHMEEKCVGGNLTIEDGYSEAMYDYPDVAFVSINSKTDVVQMNFFDATSFSVRRIPSVISPNEFYSKLSLIERFYSRNKNHVIFDVNSMTHTYLNTPRFYSTVVGNMSMNVWASQLPVRPGGSIASMCEELRGSGNPRTAWGGCQSNASQNVFYRRIMWTTSVEQPKHLFDAKNVTGPTQRFQKLIDKLGHSGFV